MKIIAIGDIVGKIGRMAVAKALPDWKTKYNPDLVIANVENVAHGKGVNRASLEELLNTGVDVFTSGNHIWGNHDVMDLFSQAKWKSILLRPHNLPKSNPGTGVIMRQIGTKSVAVINLMGRVHFKMLGTDPFQCLEDIMTTLKATRPDVILIDFHAEATAEAVAFGWFASKYASAVWGTHTHVPTRDERILAERTAYITDIGMSGFADGVIGFNREPVIAGFMSQMPNKHEIPESGLAETNAIVVDIDTSGRATSIIHLNQQFNF